jgi:hypothetical protein
MLAPPGGVFEGMGPPESPAGYTGRMAGDLASTMESLVQAKDAAALKAQGTEEVEQEETETAKDVQIEEVEVDTELEGDTPE